MQNLTGNREHELAFLGVSYLLKVKFECSLPIVKSNEKYGIHPNNSNCSTSNLQKCESPRWMCPHSFKLNMITKNY